MNGGQACVELFRRVGIDCVFGLLGGSMLELYDALAQQNAVRYIGARDERAAGHMADAYARISGHPGVVLGAQAGPGVANLVTAVAEAHLAYSPLVAIAGAITRVDHGKDTFQEIDQVALFAPICKRSLMVTSAARLADTLLEAMRLAMSGRRGPVVLHVPRDLFATEVSLPDSCEIATAEPGAPTPSQLKRVLRLLKTSKRPIIFAGGGFKSGDSSTLTELAESLGLPVVASTGHTDIMASDHPLHAGQTGPRGNNVASRLTQETDLVLALGARLAFNSTLLNHDYLNAAAKIVHVDIEASAVGRYYEVDIGIQAGASETAQALLGAAENQGLPDGTWLDWTQQFRVDRASLDDERKAEGSIEDIPLKPQRVLAEIRDGLPDDIVVTLDTGNACLHAADRLRFCHSPGLVAPLDFGLVGFGYAAALGAAAARPEQPVIAIIGDGGFGYTMAEITTAVANKLAVVAIVLDNGAWGAEKAYQQTYFDGRVFGADIITPDLSELARLCGAGGYRVERPGETATALRQALDLRGPAVIHVKVDPTAIRPLRKDLFAPADNDD